MTDEKFIFVSDVRDKKRTATGAQHRRTHCGKGGTVKFPSDFMTKKERDAMNGEVKSYRLNDPMSWAEFKAMPDDIKAAYITALRKKYNVSDSKIADMLGVTRGSVCAEMKRLGISGGTRSREKWDKDGWYAWVNGVPMKAENEAFEVAQEIVAATKAVQETKTCEAEVERDAHVVPCQGQMTLQGEAAAALETVARLLGYTKVNITVSWELA